MAKITVDSRCVGQYNGVPRVLTPGTHEVTEEEARAYVSQCPKWVRITGGAGSGALSDAVRGERSDEEAPAPSRRITKPARARGK